MIHPNFQKAKKQSKSMFLKLISFHTVDKEKQKFIFLKKKTQLIDSILIK
jgi:hypothetical protein